MSGCGTVRRALILVAGVALAGCGGGEPAPDPADAVRLAASSYVDALREQRWADACAQMTAQARRAVAGNGACARALAGGAALPPDALGVVARQLPGARVRIDGARAALGPLGDLPEPLRFARRAGEWRVAP